MLKPHYYHSYFKKIALFLLCVTAAVVGTIAADKPEKRQLRNVVMLGDSITWLGGDDCSQEKGWTKWFAELSGPGTYHSYARSGATMSNNGKTTANTTENIGTLGDNNVVYNQVLRLREDLQKGKIKAPNLVIIAAGANDAWFYTKRPDLFSLPVEGAFRKDAATLTALKPSDVGSLAESLRQNILLIREVLPNTRIIVMTPLQTSRIPAERLAKTADILEQTARKLGADVIRQDRVCPVRAADERRKYSLTYDGIHTSVLGARLNGQAISHAVDSILSL